MDGPAVNAPAGSEAQRSRVARGFAYGALGVVIFAMTLPMTRLAVGPASDPQLPPAFVTAGRAAAAGLLSLGYLWFVRAALPRRGPAAIAGSVRRSGIWSSNSRDLNLLRETKRNILDAVIISS